MSQSRFIYKQKMSPRHKFNAQQSERNGFKFDSKLEAKFYDKLTLMKQSGDVLFFLRQVPFHLPGNVVYRCDYQVFWSTGEVSFIDVKGMQTSEFKTKKRLVESLYPITIQILSKKDF